MSARDSRLSAEERAALANLEAAATASDPNLATRLRGSGPARFGAVGSRARRVLAAITARLTHLGWWGVLVAVAGLTMIVLAVSTGVWLGIAGALIGLAGFASVAHALEDRFRRSSASSHPGTPRSD